jgi:hypothetical protein
MTKFCDLRHLLGSPNTLYRSLPRRFHVPYNFCVTVYGPLNGLS